MSRRLYQNDRRKQSRKPIIFGVLFILITITTGGVYGYIYKNTNHYSLPNSVNFPVWVLKTQKLGYKLDTKSISYDARSSTLTYILNDTNSKDKLTVTEQPLPNTFEKQPEIFDQQIATLPQVTKFESTNGPVIITKTFTGEAITGIMRAKDTLVYIYAPSAAQVDDLRDVYNKLVLSP